MADCHSILVAYNDAVKLKSKDKQALRRSRNALRDRIKDKIKKRHDDTAKFYGQGSFATNTIIEPESGDYDVDDGVYFLYDEAPSTTPATFHQRVVRAVEGHTDASPLDKNPCVRVSFKAGYHVDLPIYRKIGDGEPELAHKRDGWLLRPRPFVATTSPMATARAATGWSAMFATRRGDPCSSG